MLMNRSLAASSSRLRVRHSSSTSVQQQQHQNHQQQQHQSHRDESVDSPTKNQYRSSSAPSSRQEDKRTIRLEQLKLWHSIETIKRLGHRMAQLDPLKLTSPARLQDVAWNHSLIEEFKQNKQDLIQTSGFLVTRQPLMTMSELISSIESIYVDKECGIEFEHMSNQEEVEWLTSEWERFNELFHFDRRIEQEELAKLLLECETFDHFMAAKYPTTKRYGCEGAESMLIVFDEVLRLCQLGMSGPSQNKQRISLGKDERDLIESIGQINDVIIGMPHRGRLNLMACLLGFEPAAIFQKTRGECELDTREAWMATGDVLSHLSTNIQFVYGLDRLHIGLSRDTPQPINVSLLPNPSHLEVSGPMCVGVARGRARNLHHNYQSSPRFSINSTNGSSPTSNIPGSNSGVHESEEQYYRHHSARVLPVQVHGDASVAGQGIVQETVQMANLPNFTAGGSLHLVVNNQIGYTTDSSLGRSSRYCTDIFKLIEAPIIHVNGQNIESVLRATRLALAYRQKFGKDVVIDLICYRQHGHNELDEPSFTQPLMYETIRNRKSIPQSYCDKIGIEPERRKKIVDTFREKLNEQFKNQANYKVDNDNFRNFALPSEHHRDHLCSWQTGCQLDELQQIALASVTTPAHFNAHPNLQRVLIGERKQRFSSQDLQDTKVDWASAEILAFGSLLAQNHTVRIAGQDVARGTFSTRHAVLFDQKSGQPFIPLNHMKPNSGSAEPRAQLEVCNTILSEEAALAYEFGYSTETCALTIWEAQFGDFFNTAQSIIDTLISSSETKWIRQTAMTLLLPHGLDGAGPEHSSSHIERFLQMSSSSMDPAVKIDTEANTNWSICFPTLPSQYFHLLRRQVLRPFRKPLVVMSPKVIFRHPDCQSRLADFGLDQTFKPVLSDPTCSDPSKVDTIVLCSGKVYFTLKEEKLKKNMQNVAILRIEELCPFPVMSLLEELKRFPDLARQKLIWFQEEHKNQGAFSFVEQRLDKMLNIGRLEYIGRAESELPAVGSSSFHKRELEKLMADFRMLGSSRNSANH